MVTVLSSDKKTVYNVTETSCTCPDFMFRHARAGSRCKHILKYFFTFEPADEFEFKEEIKQEFKDGMFDLAAYMKYGDNIDKWVKMNLICSSKHTGKRMFYLLEW